MCVCVVCVSEERGCDSWDASARRSDFVDLNRAELEKQVPFFDLTCYYPPRRIDDPDFGTPHDSDRVEARAASCLPLSPAVSSRCRARRADRHVVLWQGAVVFPNSGYVTDPMLATQNLQQATALGPPCSRPTARSAAKSAVWVLSCNMLGASWRGVLVWGGGCLDRQGQCRRANGRGHAEGRRVHRRPGRCERRGAAFQPSQRAGIRRRGGASCGPALLRAVSNGKPTGASHWCLLVQVENDQLVQTRPMRQEVAHVDAPEGVNYEADGVMVGDFDVGSGCWAHSLCATPLLLLLLLLLLHAPLSLRLSLLESAGLFTAASPAPHALRRCYWRPEVGNRILIGGMEPDCDTPFHVFPEDADRCSEAFTEQLTNIIYRAALRMPGLPIPGRVVTHSPCMRHPPGAGRGRRQAAAGKEGMHAGSEKALL